MNLQQFVDWALAQRSVANQDGSYKGECVSLINQYCWKVLNVPAGAWGNAVDWGYDSNRSVQTYFYKVSSPQAGDILVYPGTGSNPYGHIELYLGSNQSLGQNRSYSGLVTRGTTLGGAFAILRSRSTIVNEDKGIMNDDDAKNLWRLGLHREPENDQVWRGWVGKRFTEGSNAFRGSVEWLTQNHAIVFFSQREQQLNDAQTQLSLANQALAKALQDDQIDKDAIAGAQKQAEDALKQLNDVTTNFNGIKQQLDKLEQEKELATQTGNAFTRWIGDQLNKILGKS